ncbi:MAG: glycosyltransferase family 4 protein [Alphaproteobacteria bacterium]|nr:glycosyltransferase family 4 protein [Alphaproteobacteria bacterium]
MEKASSNIVSYARRLSRGQTPHDLSAAASAWRLVLELDPHALLAEQELVLVCTKLAEMAERSGDIGRAQMHWAEVLEFFPQNQGALTGFERTLTEALNSPGVMTVDDDDLFSKLRRVVPPVYICQYGAANFLLSVNYPRIAHRFAEKAMAQKPSAAAALLMFRCNVAIRSYPAALQFLRFILEGGHTLEAVVPELRNLLQEAGSDLLDDTTIMAIAKSPIMGAVALQVLPHLLLRKMDSEIIAVVDGLQPNIDVVPDKTLAEVIACLSLHGQRAKALRVIATFAASASVSDAFWALSQDASRGELNCLANTEIHNDEDLCLVCLALAEHYLRMRQKTNAADELCRIGAVRSERMQVLYSQTKDRLANVISVLLDDHELDGNRRRAVIDLVASWTSEPVRMFFGSDRYRQLCEELHCAGDAETGSDSRQSLLREAYFEHHLDRWENKSPEAFVSEYAYSAAVLRYFAFAADRLGVEKIPVAQSLQAHLNRPMLTLRNGEQTNLLMSAAILRDGPRCDLNSANLFGDLAAWFALEFMPKNSVPSFCCPRNVRQYCDEVVLEHRNVGLKVTRFLALLHASSAESKERFSLENPLDGVLFLLEAIVSYHARVPQYRRLLAQTLQGFSSGDILADALISALSRSDGEAFSRRLARNGSQSSFLPVAEIANQERRDVLLIGYGSPGTGLGRNFKMLENALTARGVNLTLLSHESGPAEFAETLKAWRGACRGAPIVVAAVNAHDVPALFIKDRHNVLHNCIVAGFFLWETSEAPQVQWLGASLVDEIWTPTRYVADVYRRFGPVHVVGKGLAPNVKSAPDRPLARDAPRRFVSMFDFHSSIERKNPLASALAFKKAFPGNENVELILKTTEIVPDHPSNIHHHWERLQATCEDDRRIRLVAARLSADRLQELISTSSGVISLHRSEGFGYILADAMEAGTPVIATDYSGNTDFCSETNSFPVAYELVPVNVGGAYWETAESRWAEPDVGSAAAHLRFVFEHPSEARVRAERARENLREMYSMQGFAATLTERVTKMQRRPRYRMPIARPGLSTVL